MDFQLARSMGVKITRNVLQPLSVPGNRRVLTYSSIKTFRNCRELYRLRYLLQLRKQGRLAEPLFLGSLWHELKELVLNGAECHQCTGYLKARMHAPPLDERDRKVWLYLRAMIYYYFDHCQELKPDISRIMTEIEFCREIVDPSTGGNIRDTCWPVKSMAELLAPAK